MINNDYVPKFNPMNLFNPKDINNHGIVLTAVNLGIFEALSEDFLSLKEIKEKLNLKIRERNLFDFLDKLYLNHHLLREGNDIDTVRYKNAHNFLTKSNPDNYIYFVHMTERIAKRYEILPYMIKEGRFPEDINIFAEIFSDEKKTIVFLRTMGLFQKSSFEGVAKGFDFSGYKKMVDIGGCLGNFSVAVKNIHPHLICVSFDLPVVEPHTRKFLAEKKMSDNIEIIAGDMFTDKFPKCDVVTMGNILHDWNEEKKRFLLKAAYDCLEENGTMIVVESFISNERDTEEGGLNMSFHMLLEACDGYNMTRNEMETYAKDTGFKKVEFLKEKLGVDAAVLYK